MSSLGTYFPYQASPQKMPRGCKAPDEKFVEPLIKACMVAQFPIGFQRKPKQLTFNING